VVALLSTAEATVSSLCTAGVKEFRTIKKDSEILKYYMIITTAVTFNLNKTCSIWAI
jgi:hypothetical protein